MNNNTLIAGFEDIMTHIKNQEIRIKKLEEENKKLKDTTAWEDYEQILKDAAQKKIDSLEEENKKLHNITDTTNADYEKLVDKNNNDNLNFADILSERDDEIKKLKDDLMRDELDVDDVKDANLSLKELIDELREENKKLKNTLDVWENPTGRTFVEEIQKLKKENEKWEADDDNLTKIMSMINTLDEDFSVNGADDLYECVKELVDEKYLPLHAEFMGKTTNSIILKDDVISFQAAENEKLKEEISELKEEIERLLGGADVVRMTKDIIMNLMIKIIKELCDDDSVDIEKEWQADTRGVKWTDKDYNDFMINICKEMDDDNWNDFGGISLQWKDDTLYFRRVEP